jgi:DNA-binding IclR family transcriptional regulator
MTPNGDTRDAREQLPPSCRYILNEFDTVGETLTIDELDRRLCHRRRTIRWALKTLENCGYVSLDRDSRDLRRTAATLDDERALNSPQSDT